MPQKRHTVDQIVAKLRKADVDLDSLKKDLRQIADRVRSNIMNSTQRSRRYTTN